MSNNNLMVGKTYFAIIKEGTIGTGFYDDACKQFYLHRLLHCLNAYQVKVHAYLLEPKQVLLLISPITPMGFFSLVKFLNNSYSDYFAIRFNRSVRVWRDIPSICVLPSSKLVLDCQKFIERFPLRSNKNENPGEFHYSSYCSNSFFSHPKYLSRHPAFSEFLNRETEPFRRYREFIAQPFAPPYALYLKSRLLSGRPLLTAKAQIQLEHSKTLTDKEKSGTIVVLTGDTGSVLGHAFSYSEE